MNNKNSTRKQFNKSITITIRLYSLLRIKEIKINSN
jgi:hypothetical protein